ncbi:MAG TPA: TonB-dependent receptor plug domain-containing protein, partial [Novosphingobium sp.]|nr:TonB-dependent receptor plug domain-containing protein [Novosphingobium sp.]
MSSFPFHAARAHRTGRRGSRLLLGAGLLALTAAGAPAWAHEGDAATAANAANALEAAAPQLQPETDPAETIVVTGSHAEGRAAEKSLVPISVASAQDLARSGRQNLRDALAEVLPSFQVQAGGYQVQRGAGVRGARLRGLDAKDTLVLVNGVRRHTSSLLVGGASPTDL